MKIGGGRQMLGWLLTRKTVQDGTFRSEIVNAIDTHTLAYRAGASCAIIAITVSLGSWFMPEPTWPYRELPMWLTPQAQILAYEQMPAPPAPLVEVELEEFKQYVGDGSYTILYDRRLNTGITPSFFSPFYYVSYLAQTEAGIWLLSEESISGGPCIRFSCITKFEADRGVFSYTAEERVDWGPFLNSVVGTFSMLAFFFLSYAWRFRKNWNVTLKDVWGWVTDWKTWV